MKKQLLLLVFTLMSLLASAHDIEVQNAYGVTIYYNYANNGTELSVTYRGSYYDTYSNEYSGNVVIPNEVTFMNKTRKVTSVGDEAFRKCTSLTAITIPNSVTTIGSEAFVGCSSLNAVTIPNSVTEIGAYAFESCSGLTSVTIPYGVKHIDAGVFLYCSNLTSVTIPNCVTEIGAYAFENCSALTSVTIPNSVKSIWVGAFANCSSLTSITIPNSVTEIGSSAFENCSGLTSVTIPNSVTSIGDRSFRNCSGLTSVTIGNSVMNIGDYAFADADIPTIISLIENPFAITGKTSDRRVFTQNTFNNATLYVPKGSISKYKSTSGWKDFVFIEESQSYPSNGTCEKPIISYQNGKLTFSCATENATCHYSITDTDIKEGSGNEVQLIATYNISVYAAKEGYENSETATATLCWIDKEPKSEGITNEVHQIAAHAVMVQSNAGVLRVQGAEEGEIISVYNLSGQKVGSAKAVAGVTNIFTSLHDEVAIIKIGKICLKVLVK